MTTVSFPGANVASSRSNGVADPYRFVSPRASIACVANNTSSLGTAWLSGIGGGSASLCCFRHEVAAGSTTSASSREARGRVAVDPGRAEELLRQPQPAAAADDDRAVVRAAGDVLVADAPVADVDDAVGPLRRGRVVADDERRPALLARQLGDQVEHLARGRRVELAGRLVGDQELRA